MIQPVDESPRGSIGTFKTTPQPRVSLDFPPMKHDLRRVDPLRQACQ